MFSCFPQMARSVQFNYTQEDLNLILEKKKSTLQLYSDRDMGDCGTPLIRTFQEVTGQCWLIWQCCLSISVGRDHIASWISVLQVIFSPVDHSRIHKQLPKRAAQSFTIAKQNRKSKLKTMVLWGKNEQALNSRAAYRPRAILNNFDLIFVLLLKCLISSFKC